MDGPPDCIRKCESITRCTGGADSLRVLIRRSGYQLAIPRGKSMNVIFETPRFRVQISGKAAWLESVESGEWVLRGQIAIPVAADALSGDANPSLLRDAVLDFEQV